MEKLKKLKQIKNRKIKSQTRSTSAPFHKSKHTSSSMFGLGGQAPELFPISKLRSTPSEKFEKAIFRFCWFRIPLTLFFIFHLPIIQSQAVLDDVYLIGFKVKVREPSLIVNNIIIITHLLNLYSFFNGIMWVKHFLIHDIIICSLLSMGQYNLFPIIFGSSADLLLKQKHGILTRSLNWMCLLDETFDQLLQPGTLKEFYLNLILYLYIRHFSVEKLIYPYLAENLILSSTCDPPHITTTPGMGRNFKTGATRVGCGSNSSKVRLFFISFFVKCNKSRFYGGVKVMTPPQKPDVVPKLFKVFFFQKKTIKFCTPKSLGKRIIMLKYVKPIWWVALSKLVGTPHFTLFGCFLKCWARYAHASSFYPSVVLITANRKTWVSPNGGLSSSSAPLYIPHLAIYILNLDHKTVPKSEIIPLQSQKLVLICLAGSNLSRKTRLNFFKNAPLVHPSFETWFPFPLLSHNIFLKTSKNKDGSQNIKSEVSVYRPNVISVYENFVLIHFRAKKRLLLCSRGPLKEILEVILGSNYSIIKWQVPEEKINKLNLNLSKIPVTHKPHLPPKPTSFVHPAFIIYIFSRKLLSRLKNLLPKYQKEYDLRFRPKKEDGFATLTTWISNPQRLRPTFGVPETCLTHIATPRNWFRSLLGVTTPILSFGVVELLFTISLALPGKCHKSCFSRKKSETIWNIDFERYKKLSDVSLNALLNSCVNQIYNSQIQKLWEIEISIKKFNKKKVAIQLFVHSLRIVFLFAIISDACPKATLIFFNSLHKFLIFNGSNISTKINFQVSFSSRTIKNPMIECLVVSINLFPQRFDHNTIGPI
ncbi:hypothetical protein VP01_332g2 [Puccinia sorghi]|uniref:Uncharacterized protein n=1 Tax=Puccinia sorghi TaxID=27349 RepID=A0A0L6UXA3_9BASI|nr:hypothetical protein VP01_332g2 [Puccinia sorghi]